MAWIPPKIDWNPSNGVADVDMNRIEGNIKHIFDNWLQKHKLTADNGGSMTITGANLNDIVHVGFYVGMNLLNSPDYNSIYKVEVIPSETLNWVTQKVYDFFSNKMYMRRQDGDTWKPWVEIATGDVWKQKHKLTADDGTSINVENTDINTLVYSGEYMGVNGPNAPFQGEWFHYKVERHAAGYAVQVAKAFTSNRVFERVCVNGTWQPWVEFATTAGAHMQGQLVVFPSKGTIATGANIGNGNGLEVKSDGSDAAFMSFHRYGAFAAFFGLDADNHWKVGGWSMGDVAHKIWHEGMLRINNSLPEMLINGQWRIVGGDLPVGVLQTLPSPVAIRTDTQWRTIATVSGIYGRIEQLTWAIQSNPIDTQGYYQGFAQMRITIDGKTQIVNANTNWSEDWHDEDGFRSAYMFADLSYLSGSPPIPFYHDMTIEVLANYGEYNIPATLALNVKYRLQLY